MSTQDEVFDLDAVVAEQTGKPFAFKWGGQRFAIEPILSMDIEVQIALIDKIEKLNEAVEPAELLDLLRLLVGEELLGQMRQARPVGGAALMALIREWMGSQGDALGKFAASSDSSASAAPPSKRISRSGRGRKTS